MDVFIRDVVKSKLGYNNEASSTFQLPLYNALTKGSVHLFFESLVTSLPHPMQSRVLMVIFTNLCMGGVSNHY